MFVKSSLFIVIKFSLSLFGWMLLGCPSHCPKDNRQPIDTSVIDCDSTMDAVVFLDDLIIDTTNLHCFAFDENYDRSYKDLLDSLSQEFRLKIITANIIQVAIPRTSTEFITYYTLLRDTNATDISVFVKRIDSLMIKYSWSDSLDLFYRVLNLYSRIDQSSFSNDEYGLEMYYFVYDLIYDKPKNKQKFYRIYSAMNKELQVKFIDFIPNNGDSVGSDIFLGGTAGVSHSWIW